MSITSEGMTPADIAAVTGNSRNGSNGWGGDGAWWLLVLFLFAANNGWNNGGFGGGNGGGPTTYIGTNADIQRGFDQSATMTALNNLAIGQCNQTTALQNAITQGQIANMQGFNTTQGQIANTGFNISNALNQCCCENRLATADLKYTIATENCADRAALSDGVRDIIASNTASTQAILDKLCQQELDAKNDIIANLRTQLNMQTLAASQTAQTSQLQLGMQASNTALLNELRSCPIPAQPVYGSQPIFTCPNNQNNCGCNCGCGVG